MSAKAWINDKRIFVKTKPLPQHKTKRVAIKMADVDVGIVKVIEWLNSFPDVVTMYSCEGDRPKQSGQRLPYIIFVCTESLTLCRILEAVGHYATTSVEFYKPMGGLRYSMTFATKEALAMMTDNLTGDHIK